MLAVKKITVVLLIAVLCLTALTGCSKDEVAFYNLTTDLSQLQAYTGSGEMTIAMDMSFVTAMADETITDEEKALLAAFKDIKLTYSIKGDVTKTLSEIDLAVAFGGNKYDLGKIYMNNNGDFYFNSQKTLALLAPFISEAELNQCKKLIGDGKWLKVNMLEHYGDNIDITSLNQWAQDFVKASLNAGDKFINVVAKDYSSGLVKKSGIGYEFLLTDKNALPFIKSFAEFVINNIEEIGAWYKELLADPAMKSYIQMLGVPNVSAEEINAAIDEVVATIKADKEGALTQLAALESEDAQKALAMIEGSKLRYYIDKSAGNFNDQYEMIINVKEGSLNYFSMNIALKESYRPTASVSIDIPTEGVVDLEQLIEDNAQSRVAFIHSADCEQYVYNQSLDLFGGMTLDSNSGEIEIKMINDRAYLPLRLTCELLGATVNWDQATQQASIKTEKFSGKVQGKVINDHTYIPVREFEKYGYTVEYVTDTANPAYQDWLMSFWGEQAAQYLIIVTK